jgi:secondary thiamine-phosphate synthase enzyme
MKSVSTIKIRTSSRSDMVDITSQVRQIVSESGISDGVCIVFAPHTTAGITINEGADPNVCTDILGKLNDLVPRDGRFLHMEGNSDSHVKASLVGSSVSVIVEKGSLVLGTWQKIFFCEFDGPRSRRIYLTI